MRAENCGVTGIMFKYDSAAQSSYTRVTFNQTAWGTSCTACEECAQDLSNDRSSKSINMQFQWQQDNSDWR